MPKILLLSVFLLFTALWVKGQENITIKGDSAKLEPSRTDTSKVYVNPGKIAGRKAALRSAMIPGWGQVGNGLTIYRGVKVAAIYTGGVMLALSFMDNTTKYHQFLKEIQYREDPRNGGRPLEGNGLEQYNNLQGLITAKDIYRRNREVIIFSFVGLYAINIIEAYIDARLKYFDIGNDLTMKISPAVINSNTMYGYHSSVPGIKLTFGL